MTVLPAAASNEQHNSRLDYMQQQEVRTQKRGLTQWRQIRIFERLCAEGKEEKRDRKEKKEKHLQVHAS